MAWIAAILLVASGVFLIGISLGELLPKLGYIVMLGLGLYGCLLGAYGISDLSGHPWQ